MDFEFKKVDYQELNARQKEAYNFANLSALLASYGLFAIRLSDDWKGADLIAQHRDGFLKIQLKSRLWVDSKYKGKELWMAFPLNISGRWLVYPHDDFLRWSLENLKIGTTAGWRNTEKFEFVEGAYSWPRIPTKAKSWLSKYELH